MKGYSSSQLCSAIPSPLTVSFIDLLLVIWIHDPFSPFATVFWAGMDSRPKGHPSAGNLLKLYPNTVHDERELSLVGVAEWIKYRPVNQRVAGLIPSQGTCLGCRPGPQYGVSERQPHIDVSLSLSPSLLLSLKINKIFLKIKYLSSDWYVVNIQ